MDVISVRNVEEALILGTQVISSVGRQQDSRNGPVKVMPMPTTTVYSHPRERVLFLEARDANPYFHFMESLWMMAGRNDVAWIGQFNSGMVNYSDNGVTFHGAYGHRWRSHFVERNENDNVVGTLDQLATIAAQLHADPNDRRTVLQMWDAPSDLGFEGKDFPCNLIITFRINGDGHLDMTVFNRSNDMVWGAYGANAVHMSFMQEVMASWIGVPVGRYWQISTNFHAYLNTLEQVQPLMDMSPGFTPYETGDVLPFPIVNTDMDTWLSELNMFMDEGAIIGYTDPFFKKVASPMLQSWIHWKDRESGDYWTKAMQSAMNIEASDWRKACVEWLERRA